MLFFSFSYFRWVLNSMPSPFLPLIHILFKSRKKPTFVCLFVCISEPNQSISHQQVCISFFFFSFVAMTRNLEKRSGAGNGSPSRNSGGSGKVVSRSTAGKRSPPTPENIDRKMPSSRSAAKDEKSNGSIVVADHQTRQVDSTRAQSEKEAGATNSNPASVPVVASGGEKVNNNEVIEWPRIYIALSRKEKEDDFFAMKGTKLPQRPKKRAKNIDKALQVITNLPIFFKIIDIACKNDWKKSGFYILCIWAVLFSRDVALWLDKE